MTLTDDRVAGDVVTDADTAANFADKNVGLDKSVSVTGITITGADAGNYSLASGTATTTASITPAPLTITVANQTMVPMGPRRRSYRRRSAG